MRITQECLYRPSKSCARGTPGRHRPRHPAARGGQLLLRGSRVLRPRHRHRVPRGSAGAALRPPRNTGLELKPGMTFTIEPMINAGKRHTKLNARDGWTVTTRDGRLSAQWEHTLGVTEDGCEVFTRRSDETSEALMTGTQRRTGADPVRARGVGAAARTGRSCAMPCAQDPAGGRDDLDERVPGRAQRRRSAARPRRPGRRTAAPLPGDHLGRR
jgi:hypothetical protein